MARRPVALLAEACRLIIPAIAATLNGEREFQRNRSGNSFSPLKAFPLVICCEVFFSVCLLLLLLLFSFFFFL